MKPEDLRAEIARQQVNRYVLAAEVRVHPGRLGMMLRGSVPMPTDVAQRVADALKRRENSDGPHPA
jgi:hypothetical protein